MLDRIIAASLRNRGGVLAATLVLLLVGIWAFSRLPIDAVPDITNNQVQILTEGPALSALEIERFVTLPIELAVKSTPDVVELRSLSRPGLSVVTVVFDDNVDIYFARQLLLEGLRSVDEKLPRGVGRPELGPVTTGLGEIFRYVVRDTTGRLSAADLRSIQDWIVRRGILGADALAEVNSLGGELKQYRVTVDPDRLAAYNLTLREVFHAATEASGNAGGGYIETGPEQLAVRSVALATSLDDLRRTVVRTANDGVPVTLGDVAEIETGPALRFGSASQDGGGEVVVGIVMQLKGSNARTTVAGVKERIEAIVPSLPDGVVVEPFYDREELVDRTIATVATNLVEGALLVIGVLLLLLVSLRAGLVVASVIPLAMCFAGIMMLVTGQSGNLMSLGAIDFGLVVDGSLIIVENVLRLLDRFRSGPGAPADGRIDAELSRRIVYDGAIEVRKAAQYGEIIIIVVYLPILTLGGIEGKLFGPMALTVSFALIGALLLSITYVPALLSFLLPGQKKIRHSPIIESMRRLYRRLLDRALIRPTVVIASTILLVALGLFGFTRLGGEFIPRLDEGDIAMHLIRLPSISLTESQKLTTMTERVIMRFPEVRTVVSHTGRAEVSTDPMGFELADIFIMLRPEREWTTGRTKQELVAAMEDRITDEVPGVGTQFLQPIEMRTNELIAGARGDVVIRVFGEEFALSGKVADEVAAILRSVSGGADVAVEQTEGLPQLVIRPDRARIARYGLRVADINRIVETSVGGAVAGEIFEGERRYDLVVRLDDATRTDPDALGALIISTPTGARLPLSELASIAVEKGPVQVSRREGERFTTVQANVRGRDVAGYVAEIRARIATEVALPSGYRIDFGGAFENLQAATNRLMIVVPIALLLVFSLLYRTFSSVRTATIIFLCIPMSVVGGVAALMLRGLPFSISAGVGFIALFGIAVLNGIVMLAAIRRYRQQGLSSHEALRRGADDRFRPVVTTAALAGFGFLPMMLATSAGAEVQRPLATVVVGGLVSSTILTLFVLPVLYRRFGERSSGETGRAKRLPAALLLLFAATTGPLYGQVAEISQPDFLERFVRSSGIVDETVAEIGVVDATYRADETIRSVRVGAGVEEFPTRDLPGSPTYRLGLETSLAMPGTYRSRRQVRAAAVEVAARTGDAARRERTRQGLDLWHRLVESDRQRRLTDSLADYAREVVRITRARRRVGDVDSLEALRAELLLAGAVDDSIVASGEQMALRSLAERKIDLPDRWRLRSGLPAADSLLRIDRDEILGQAIATDPTIALIDAQGRHADAAADVAAATRAPTIDLGLGVASVDGRVGYLEGEIGLEMSIGRWGSDPAVEAETARRAGLDLVSQRRSREIAAEILPLLDRLVAADQRLVHYDQRVLPLLREQTRVVLLLYRNGASPIRPVVDAHEELVAGSFERLHLATIRDLLADELRLLLAPIDRP